ncbi:hypothetical protein Droror1_Dr00009598 [Drosera rotundifolia]
MLHTTHELIAAATSSPPLIFCLFNIIVLFLVISSSNGSSNTASQISETAPVICAEDNASVQVRDKGDYTGVVETCHSETAVIEVDDKGDVEEAYEEEDEAEEEDKLLRRRIEAFIEKVNQEWRAEKLAEIAMSSYVDCR